MISSIVEDTISAIVLRLSMAPEQAKGEYLATYRSGLFVSFLNNTMKFGC